MLRKSYRIRIVILFFALILFAVLLGARLYYLQYVNHSHWAKRAAKQQARWVIVKPHRGNIYSRNLHLLAGSTMMDSIYVNPNVLPGYIRPILRNELEEIFGPAAQGLTKKFAGKTHFALARKVSQTVCSQVRNLALKHELHAQAFYFVRESKRHYPMGELAAHCLGFTTYDNHGDNIGKSGLELTFNKTIRGSLQKERTGKLSWGDSMRPLSESVVEATQGNDLILTIDENIQHLAESALLRAINKYRAIGGAIVVQRTRTGEILALANVPTYNPNQSGRSLDFQRRNRAITDCFEPGSVMKLFTFATLIEEDLCQPETIIDCGGGVYVVNRRVIRDAPGHRLDKVTMIEVLQWSSNAGTVRAAQAMTPALFHRYLKRFGFGSKTGIELPGEAKGFLARPSAWNKYTMTSVPMGYEVMTTSLQLVSAVSALGNGGVLPRPTIVRELRDPQGQIVEEFEPHKVRRVVSTLTAKKLLSMMEAVVRDGTGKKAQIPGYRVAGKTGTAHKLDPETKTYAKRYMASFVGIVPVNDPQLTIYCYVDDPQGKKYGGDVAAPVFREVAENALRVLGIPPTESTHDESPDFEIVLDQHQNSGEQAALAGEGDLSAAARRTVVAPGRMPELKGLTMREALTRLSANGVGYDFQGSGRAASQSPAANTALKAGQVCQVVFKP